MEDEDSFLKYFARLSIVSSFPICFDIVFDSKPRHKIAETSFCPGVSDEVG